MQQEFAFEKMPHIATQILCEKVLTERGPIFISQMVNTEEGLKMTDLYRGFEVSRKGGLFQIFEAGKLIDDAASETAAYDRIDKILSDRRAEDQAENLRNFR